MSHVAERIVDLLRLLDPDGSGKIARTKIQKVLVLLDPSGQWTDYRIGSLLAEAGLADQQASCGGQGSIEYERFIWWLLDVEPRAATGTNGNSRLMPLSSPPPQASAPAARSRPVKERSMEERENFLINLWSPYLAELAQHVEDAKTRARRCFQPHEVLPAHGVLHELVQRCLALTKEWHGRANVSAMYEAFMEMAQYDGHSPFLFDSLAKARSADGYIRLVDGSARFKAYSAGQNQGQSLPFVGRIVQRAGESPIDNLVLPPLLRRTEASMLFVGNRIRCFFVRALQKRQRRILAARGANGASEHTLSQETKASLAYRMLIHLGGILESYGQLPEDVRTQADKFLADEIGADRGPKKEEQSQTNEEQKEKAPELEADLEAFLTHCWKHPGRAFQGSQVQHKLMLFKAMASKAVRFAQRSDIEQFTQHKYFTVPWTRAVPLVYLPQPSKASAEVASPSPVGAHHPKGMHQLVELRPAGAKEITRFRKNIFAYGEAHGLGQSGGGCAERWHAKPGSWRFELGTLLCEDEAAKVPNHWVTDIEKIIRDCVMTCPAGGEATALPGEVLHDSGQNPTVASSIGPTQHTQVMASCAEDFPLMSEQSRPVWRGELNAMVDIVQVGSHSDAFFVSFRTRHPDSYPLLKYIIDLRTHLLQLFGPAVDFAATCHPNKQGEYLINIAPLCCVRRLSVPMGEGLIGLSFDYENEMGQRSTQFDLAAALVDCSHGKGNFVLLSDVLWDNALVGRPKLAALYDFNRKVGARSAVEAFLQMSSSL